MGSIETVLITADLLAPDLFNENAHKRKINKIIFLEEEKKTIKDMHLPGIEPGSCAWEA